MSLRNKRNLWRDRRGSAAIEFAMVLPIIVTMMFGTMELGRYFLTFSSISSATEQLSRYVMIDPDATSTELEAQLEGFLIGIDADDLTLDFSNEVDAATGLTFQVVDVSLPHSTMIPFADMGTMTIRSRVRTPLPPA